MVLDHHVLPFNVTGFVEGFAERSAQARSEDDRGRAILLRVRDEEVQQERLATPG